MVNRRAGGGWTIEGRTKVLEDGPPLLVGTPQCGFPVYVRIIVGGQTRPPW